ncbi:hypothetical protein TNCV_2757131 [Trichonephila clavipes]|nr:hypothetical protein TNCV_2757131 [Trichonephila clavipes]
MWSHVFTAKHTDYHLAPGRKPPEPGELISADVCGLFDESFSEEKVLWLYSKTALQSFCLLLPNKREVRSKKGVRAHACTYKRTLGYSVKEFLCDNGGEFDNKDVHEIFAFKWNYSKAHSTLHPRSKWSQ